MNCYIPGTQRAVQLTGPNELRFNPNKRVYKPGPYQILYRVEAVGLCFSDLKLLKQFSSHVRKGEIIDGIEPEVLKKMPGYVPGDAATVPGHESVLRVVAVGEKVGRAEPGQRFLLQPDYRWLRTARANAAFGYNFEGALQEYVLIDQRAVTSPEGESMLIEASEGLSSSAVALVEPWACVENAYAASERRSIKADSKMLVLAEVKIDQKAFIGFLNCFGKPAQITWISQTSVPGADILITRAANVSELAEAEYDDVIYFGSRAESIEALFRKVRAGGLLNIVLCGGSFGTKAAVAVGRVHYEGVRVIGTAGDDPAESMRSIPALGGIRRGDKINVVGAGGPMGAMHVVRNLCQGVEGISVFAGDVDEDRLAALNRIAGPLAKKNNIVYRAYNPRTERLGEQFDYVVLMVPAVEVVAESVKTAAIGGIVNIFAGISTAVTGKIDLDAYIRKRLYFVGTSGSVSADMKAVLDKLQAGRLNTDVSVAAVCGFEGASEGIRAVENRLVPGKIIVYPACKGLGLVKLAELAQKIPQVAKALVEGVWNKDAEKILLAMYQD